MESERSKKMVIGLCAVALILLGKLFYIQIIDDKYKTDALNNSIVYETIYPPRGFIYDRYGNVLVGNTVTYDLLVTPKEVKEFDTLSLARILDVDTSYINNKMRYYKRYRTKIGYRTVVFYKQLSGERYLKFAEEQFKFPGFSGQQRTIRNYPINAGGNLLGYVSEVDANYMSRNPEYKAGDFTGITGIEAARETDLRGEKGYNIYLRDSRNRKLTSYDNGAQDKAAVAGQDIYTTIDAQLQQYGQQLMKSKRGSLIAIEPSTGEILSLVSSPGIDVDILPDFRSHYDSLSKDPYKPMFNRAVQASYPPGSVFKIVNALIGLQEKVLYRSRQYPCYEGYSYGETLKLGCHTHRSPLNLTEAIMMSCNAYFCFVFKSILENRKYADINESFGVWEEYVRSFGFGAPLGSDFPNENGGNIPTADNYNKIYGRKHWKFESVISLSIGQGEIGVTPLQIANLSATIANRGWYITPHITRDFPQEKSGRNYTMVDSVHFETLVQGMWQAVNFSYEDGATATLARLPGLDVCGKTGTAENPHGADHSVFICFAPRNNPQIAVAAFVENAGFGATWACPLASLMVEKYINGEIAPGRKWLEDRVITADLMNVKPKEKKKTED